MNTDHLQKLGLNGSQLLPGDPSRFSVKINYKNAERALNGLIAVFRNREYPFKQFISFVKPILEKPLPDDPKERAIFWFCLCFWMRGRIESYEALWRLARVWHRDSELFKPEFWSDAGDEKRERLARALKMEGLSVGVEKYHKNDWHLNMAKLQEFWDGDPQNLIRGAKTFKDLLSRIQNRGKFSKDKPNGFRGFQRKMVAMLAHFLSADDLIRAEQFPFPVDIHVGRFLLYQRAIEVYESQADGSMKIASGDWDLRYEDVVGPAIKLCLRYMKENGVGAVELGDAVWNFAAMMCAEVPQNRWLLKSKVQGRKTLLTPITVTDTKRNFSRFVQTCSVCPVSKFCRGGTIGTAPYFYWGTFSWRESPSLWKMFPQIIDVAPSLPLGKPSRAWKRILSGEGLGPGLWLTKANGLKNQEKTSEIVGHKQGTFELI